jgi:hypothetical protein
MLGSFYGINITREFEEKHLKRYLRRSAMESTEIGRAVDRGIGNHVRRVSTVGNQLAKSELESAPNEQTGRALDNGEIQNLRRLREESAGVLF